MIGKHRVALHKYHPNQGNKQGNRPMKRCVVQITADPSTVTAMTSIAVNNPHILNAGTCLVNL